MKIGTDITQISRIEKALEKFGDRFKSRFLTVEEIAQTTKISSLAGRWAAKEAISKALGCGIGSDLSFHDIIITKDSRGAPHFTLSEQAKEKFPIAESSLSISHDGGFAIAVVAITMVR
jgi:holo-[acyl-carrier protein] synthase